MAAKKTAAPASKVKGLAEFRAAHDKNFIIPQKFRAGITRLGKDGWEYEAEFWKASGISTTDGAKFREQFEDFTATVEGGRKHIYCGSKALAANFRGMGA